MSWFAAFLLIVLGAGSVQASGVLLKKGQSGFVWEVGYLNGEDTWSGGMAMGYSFLGKYDIGLEGERTSGSASAVSQVFAWHLQRIRLAESSTVIFSLHEALEIVDGGWSKDYKLASGGGTLSFRVRASAGFGVLFQGGFFGTVVLESGHRGSGEGRLSTAFTYYSKSVLVSFVPTLVIGEKDRTYVGASLVLMALR